MKIILFIFLLVGCVAQSSGQGSIIISTGTHVKSSGNAYLVLDSSHLVNNGTLQMAAGDGTVKFTGAINNNLSGGGTTTIDRLHLAKAPSSNLLLQTNIAVATEVNFSTGLLNLGSNVLDLGSTAALINESEVSRAFTQSTGYIQANAILNAPASVNMGNLGAIITSSANMGNTSIKRGNEVQVVAGRNSILRYFDITPANNTSLNASLRFQYFDAELNTLDESALSLWKSADKVNWTQVGNNSGNATANYVEKTGISDFSRWTLAPQSLNTYYHDSDGDGYGNPAATIRAYSLPSGYVSTSTDCNDGDRAVHPGATEVCNGIDDNCNGQTDEGVKTTFYRDADGDGYGDINTTNLACSVPAGYVSNSTDCNDAVAAIKPTTMWYLDADGDGYYIGTGVTQCASPGTGYKFTNLTAGGDCNDASSAVHPGATEVCNGIDDDCNGMIDEGVKMTFYRDADGDGYGNLNVTTQACSAPAGYVSNSTDCNDNNPAVQSGITYFKDADGDGYGSSVTTNVCNNIPPAGYAIRGGDCNDNNKAINPGAAEVCGNNIDDNCDGQIDEGCNNKVLLSITDATVYESAGKVTLTVTLSKQVNQAVSVNYSTVDGSAKSKATRNNAADFTAQSGTLTIPAGSQSVTVTIPIISDNQQESSEQFSVLLGKPVNAAIHKGTGTVTILNGAAKSAGKTPYVMEKATPANEVMNEKLMIRALPNPSNSYFTLVIRSNSTRLVSMQVSDAVGRMLEGKRVIAANTSLRTGQNLRPGVYFVQVMQGSEAVTLKLIKQ